MRSFGLNFGLVRLGKRLFCSRTRRRVWRLMVGKLNFINHSVYASFELIFAMANQTREKCRLSVELSQDFPQGLLRDRRSFDPFAARVKSWPFPSPFFFGLPGREINCAPGCVATDALRY
jgi:hypothetical protein